MFRFVKRLFNKLDHGGQVTIPVIMTITLITVIVVAFLPALNIAIMGGDWSVNGATIYLNRAGYTVTSPTGTVYVDDLLPNADSTWDVGAIGNEFANGYFDKLYVGNAEVVRTANYVVAASNAAAYWIEQADYICDGTDDDVQINAAIAALPVGGGTVILSNGTFHVAATIDILNTQYGVQLIGQGNNVNGYLTGGNGGTAIRAVNAAGLDRIIDNWGQSSTYRDFLIDGNHAGGGTAGGATDAGFYSQALNAWIEGIAVVECLENGFIIGSQFAYLDRCISEYNEDDGYEISCQRGSFLNCFSYNNAYHGYRIQGYDSVYHACHAVLDGRYGFYIYGQKRNILDGCVADSNGRYGIVIEGAAAQNNIVNGCEVHNASQSANNTYDAIAILNTASENLIVNNIVTADAANKHRYGIYEINTALYNIYKNNFITDSVTAPVSLLGVATIARNNQQVPNLYEMEQVYMENTSGGALVAGNVVVYKAVAAGDEFTTTVNQGDDLVCGMLAQNIGNNAYGYIQTLGFTTLLKVNGTVAIGIGDFIGTHTNAGIGRQAAAGDMAFAIALEAYAGADDNGVIDALLITPRKI